jgi:hypothetical protein
MAEVELDEEAELDGSHLLYSAWDCQWLGGGAFLA